MRGFVLINESGDPDLTRERVLAIAAANAAHQIELAAWWQRTPLEVRVADAEATAPQEDGWTLAKIVPALDDPDALAYHTTTEGGRPLILIGAGIVRRNAPRGADWIAGPDSLATATSHELAETAVNPYVGFYAPLDRARWIPLEVCDPVQGDAYEPTPGVFCSNFVGPRYFSDSAGPFDRMGLVAVARSIRPGGYQEQLTGGPGGLSQSVFGALPHEGGMAEWKRRAKARPGSRRSRIEAAWEKGTDALATATAELDVTYGTIAALRAALDRARRGAARAEG